MVPTFTHHRSVSGAPSSTPAASPRLCRRPSAWPPHRCPKPASELAPPTCRWGSHALHPGPDPPGSSRLNAYGASTTGSLSLHLLTSLDEPAPSGSSGTFRRCRGCFPPSPPSRGSGFPQLHQVAATAWRTGLSPLSIDARLVAHLGAIQGDDHGPGVAPSTVTTCRSPVGLRRRRHRDEHRVRLPDPTRARRHGGGVDTRGLRASSVRAGWSSSNTS